MTLESCINYWNNKWPIEAKSAFAVNLFGISIYLTGERLQDTAIEKLIGYNWAVGHMSDFGWSFGFSAAAYSMSELFYATSELLFRCPARYKECFKIAGSLLPPIIATLNEYYSILSQNVTDSTDTVLYWGGWAASIVLMKYLSSMPKKRVSNHAALQKSSEVAYSVVNDCDAVSCEKQPYF